jgi:hypothetical protein
MAQPGSRLVPGRANAKGPAGSLPRGLMQLATNHTAADPSRRPPGLIPPATGAIGPPGAPASPTTRRAGQHARTARSPAGSSPAAARHRAVRSAAVGGTERLRSSGCGRAPDPTGASDRLDCATEASTAQSGPHAADRDIEGAFLGRVVGARGVEPGHHRIPAHETPGAVQQGGKDFVLQRREAHSARWPAYLAQLGVVDHGQAAAWRPRRVMRLIQPRPWVCHVGMAVI